MPVLCFIIHGIGTQTQEYSAPLQEGIHRELKKLVALKRKTNRNTFQDVDATDLVDFRALYWGNVGTNAQAKLFRTLYPDLFGDSSWKRWWNSVVKFAAARSISVNLLGDIFGYLGQFQEPIKRTVLTQIREALEEAAHSKEAISIILVGHSLGAVILHDLIAGFLSYRYAEFDKLAPNTSIFTMGSPLSLFSLIANRAKPDKFRGWINFVHDRDLIAFPMQKLFSTARDISVRSFFRNPISQWSPLYLHGAYWNSKRIHRHIADEILGHHEQHLGITLTSVPGPVPPEIYQPLVGGLNMAGLSQCFADFKDVPFKQLIATAREIDFFNIYGGSWLAQHEQYFAKALAKPDVRIRACIMSPDNPGLPGLAYHFSGKSVEQIKHKIEEAMVSLERTATDARKQGTTAGHLKIYRTKNMVNHSFYRFDDMVYFAPRPLASSKNASTPIPCFAFRRTSEPGGAYEWIIRDFEEMLQEPKDVSLDYDSAVATA